MTMCKWIAYIEVTMCDNSVYYTRVVWDYDWQRRRIDIDPNWSKDVMRALIEVAGIVEQKAKDDQRNG